MTAERRRIIVRGRVQGVGFRFFARDLATRLGLTGFVRNLSDGRSVEAVVQGPRNSVDLFASAMRAGPPGSFVSDYDESAEPPDPAADWFSILT